MSDPITVYPIGVVSGGRSQIFEDHWGTVVSRLILHPTAVAPDATLGLGEFSHIEEDRCAGHRRNPDQPYMRGSDR